MNKYINTDELAQLIDSGSRITLLDVRREVDVMASESKINGAQWLSPGSVDLWGGDIAGDRKAVIYCVKGGQVSQSVAGSLSDKGIDAVFLEGGLKAWQDGGFPVVNNPLFRKPYAIRESDIQILKNAGMSDEDIIHSRKVAEKALEIADRIKQQPLDMEFIGRAALFHDLGKARTHGMEHGRIGAEMGSSLGLSKAITDVMEKHIRGGLTPFEAQELGLPVKDYTLYRLEERIIIYADRLVDIITEDIVSIRDEKQAEEQFEHILSTILKYEKNDTTRKRYLNYHKEITALTLNLYPNAWIAEIPLPKE
ncbi:HDIG domain-containing metalloprotein [Desulfobacter sp.]|uniref:HDIG domain-containing metalloprotein n=1 Tax=Desulfobacter sp. TaxID=2294 RepID=UPI003D11307A